MRAQGQNRRQSRLPFLVSVVRAAGLAMLAATLLLSAALGMNVVRATAGGGGVQEAGYDPQNGSFTSEPWDASQLTLVSANPIVYTRQLPDGGSETYSQSDGSMGSTRRIFLTKISDSAGNTVTLNYDNQLRLVSISDATGRNTTFSYNLAADSLLVTDITDPFNRTAHLSYDSGTGTLVQITDVFGMTSQMG